MKKFYEITSTLKRFLLKAWESPLVALMSNVFLVYVGYMVCRVAFLFENYELFSQDLDISSIIDIFRGGTMFDTAALIYTNALYIVMVLLPLHWKEKGLYYKVAKWVFVTCNALCFIINLADTAFYPYRLNRTTAMIFSEFGNEENIGIIVGQELLAHWYLVLLVVAMIWGLIKLYRNPGRYVKIRSLKRYYIQGVIVIGIVTFLSICGIRGSWLMTASRPISIGESHLYAHTPAQTALVLNTPFSIIRTINQTPVKIPKYYKTQEELDMIYTPLHHPGTDRTIRKKNVVVLIVESFATEFIGGLNKGLDVGKYKGYTPFADSLLNVSMTFEQTFANTGFSIDAMPAVLASIPRMDRPFVLSPYSTNSINSLASELGKWGYNTSFFHGATNESMGFNAFSHHAGFQKYYGRDEYCDDKRFGGMQDWDGTWAIWDERFLQFFCTKLSETPQPFMASLFTATSHHPFNIPDEYRSRFKDEGKYPIHKCIKYTDWALRRFFETASKQPWYHNTIFVITADHASSKTTHDVYKTELGAFRVPIIFFDPSGEMPRGTLPGIAQQTDIMPTILDWLGYDKDYIAFGKPLLAPDTVRDWAFNWDHIPQYIYGDYVMQFDIDRVKALYNYKTDPLLHNNLVGKGIPEEKIMERRIKALLQSYMERGSSDKFIIR